MGRRISFQCVVLLCGLVSVYTYSMEVEKKPVNGLCFFIKLPVEVLNSIAYWLVWESQQEFIKRTQTEDKVPSEYYRYFPCDDITYYTWKDYEEPKNVSAVFCPDKSKVALFEMLTGNCVDKPKLIIVDIKKEKEEEKIVYNNALATGNYQPIGLSSWGKVIATAQKKQILNDNGIIKTYKYGVMVQNIYTQEFCTFEMSPYCIPFRIAFNKQGTHVVTYINDESKFPDIVVKHAIFSLKEKDDSLDESNLLLNYFKHHQVCQKL